MKNRKQICLVLTCIMIMVPILGQNAKGAIVVGDYSFGSTTTSGFYVIWEVTSVDSFKISTCDYYGCYDREVNVGDQFKFIVKGKAYFDNYNPWSGEGDPTQHPCISATLSYYNATTEAWTYVIGSSWGSSSAFFMYNSTSDTYFGSGDYYGKYMLFILPSNVNLSLLGDGVLFEESRNTIYSIPWDASIATTDTLNFTDSSNDYNYIKLRNDGIVDTWDYKYNSEQIVVEYLSTGHEAAPVTIPFGHDYLVHAGILVVGLLIIVRKKILIRKEN